MKKKVEKFVVNGLMAVADKCEKTVMSPRFGMMVAMFCMVTLAFAQNGAGDYTAGTTALGTVTTEIAKLKLSGSVDILLLRSMMSRRAS